MKVSILLPFKNAEKWIEETIRSIQIQDHSDWELIAVDDFSADASFEKMQAFALKDKRIVLLQNLQQGIIPALQLAFKHSSGDAITRMDADDIMPPARLNIMINALANSSQKPIITGKVKYFSETSVSEGYQKYEDWLNERIGKNDHWQHIYRECVIASPNWMVRKKDLEEFAIFDNLQYPEDYDMCFQWLHHNFKVVSIDAVTLLWREHPQRTSRNSDIYQQASFFQLKMDWFIRNYPSQSIAILGAGVKGKLIAKQFIERDIPFRWYDWQSEKYKAGLFDQPILSMNDFLKPDILLIAFTPSNELSLLEWCNQNQLQIGTNAFIV